MMTMNRKDFRDMMMPFSEKEQFSAAPGEAGLQLRERDEVVVGSEGSTVSSIHTLKHPSLNQNHSPDHPKSHTVSQIKLLHPVKSDTRTKAAPITRKPLN